MTGRNLEETAGRTGGRDPFVEGLRIVAAFAIVWYHAGIPGHAIAYSGLVIFVLLTFAFDFGPNLRRPLAIPALAGRLLAPWAVWWIVYALFNLSRNRAPLDLREGWLAAVLAGPSIHLWYLPFLFATLVLLSVPRRILPAWALAIIAGAATTALLLCVPIWRPASMDAGAPLAQYAHALIPVGLGALAGLARHGWPGGMGLAATGPALVLGPALAFEDVGLPYLLGLLALAVTFFLGRRAGRPPVDPTRWSGAMLGVYLMHPLALAAVRPLTERAGPAGVVVAFGLSLAATLALRRAAPRAARFVVG